MSSHAHRRVVLSAFVLALVSTLIAADASAQRRRAVRPSRPRAVLGPCHTWGFVPAGLKAAYRTTSPGQPDVTFEITYVSDTAALSKFRQKVNVPGQGTADAETTIQYEAIGGGLRAVREMELKSSMTVQGFKITIDADSSFVPSLTWGPAASWCQGATWSIPATTLTTTTTTSPGGTQTAISTTLAGTGQVLSVNETISVTAGSFQTVKYRGVNTTSGCPAGSSTCTSGLVPVNAWLWKTHPIVVRQDSLDAGGNVTSTTQLTSVTVPAGAFMRRVQ